MNLDLTKIPPEVWTSLAAVAATLLVQAAHVRGRRLPLVESILDWINAGQRSTQPAPSEELNAMLTWWRSRAGKEVRPSE